MSKAQTPSRIISFVMPVLNEARHLVAAVESVFNQELPGGMKAELVLALGPSTDATNQIATDLQAQYPTLTLVDNPKGLTASGLNRAIAATSGSIVVRVDAHSKLTPGYVLTAVGVLDSNPKIGNVGGRMLAQGETGFESAVAWAYGSRYGLGGGKFHVGGDPGEVDTVYLGVFRKEALVKAGFFDESLVRGQDWELNQRIRAEGYVIWFDPRLQVVYRPRSEWSSLLSQFYKTGLWRGKLSRETFPNISFRYLTPPALVLLTLLWVPAWVYLLTVAALAITAKDLRRDSKCWLLVVLPTMHYSWGIGFILGILFPSIAKSGDD